jgi:methyl-accepting chemotaxis protein
MLRSFEKLGLRQNLFITFAAVLAVFITLSGVFVSMGVRDALDAALHDRQLNDSRLLAGQMVEALAVRRDDIVDQVLDESGIHAEDDAYAVVLYADRSVAGATVASGTGLTAEQILTLHANKPPYVVFEAAPGVAGLTYAVHRVERGPNGATKQGEVVGYILHGHLTERIEQSVARIRLWTVLLMTGGGIVLTLVMFALTRGLLLKPLTEMSAVAGRVSDCDLSARAQKLTDDELGALAESLNRIGENLTTTLSRVREVSDGVGFVIERISRTGATVSEGSGTVSARVAETSASMSDMIKSLKGIADNVEVLAQSADESSSSILQMAATNSEVAENIQGLAASVEETTAAIEQMTYSIKEVAKNIEDLSATAEETSSSMNEMDVSINQVETNANETAKLSEQATKDAELGAEAIARTLAGIEKIKGSSKEAAEVIGSLGKKIGTIGNILNVIDEVAEQTNLLALNAAILAAQSGEHGKGFAVVADEIKDLAERTGASTKEIAELIRSVQDESANAVSAMDRGVKNVEEGVRLGQEAEGALKKIQASSTKSTHMVKAIARATIEQAHGSKQVTMAINRIAETVQQISSATGEQARGSEQIMKSAEKMKVITKHVERSSQEQARGSKQITRAIESISEMVNHLNRAQKDQTKGSERVMGAVDQIKQVAEAQTHSVKDLESAIGDLASQADVLRSEVKRFKLG